ETMQWLFWQMANLGPMSGQNNHFTHYAVDKIQYAMDRYRNEGNRLYGVLNRRLADRAYLAGDYSIADMASYPWIVPYERQGQRLEDFPNLKRLVEAIKARPATVRRDEMRQERQALVRGHQGAAGARSRLRDRPEGQSAGGRADERGRQEDHVRPDRCRGPIA